MKITPISLEGWFSCEKYHIEKKTHIGRSGEYDAGEVGKLRDMIDEGVDPCAAIPRQLNKDDRRSRGRALFL